MKTVLNWLLTGFAVFFAVPSFLILASWNAIPGDGMYPVKKGLENIALSLTLKTPLGSKLSVKYTERRFSEANVLLSKKGSTLGYQILVAEAKDSKKIIVDNNDEKRAADLVQKIEDYQKEISQKQVAIETGGVSIPTKKESSVAQKPQATPQTTTAPSVTEKTSPPESARVVITPAQSTEEVISDLEETRVQLEVIKEEIIRELPAAASDRAREVQEELRDKDRGNPHR